MNRILIFILTISLFSACQPSEEVIITVVKEDIDLYVAGELREAGQDEFKDFRIDFSDENETFGKTFWHGTISAGELGTTYILGNYASDIIATRPLFGLQFWSDTLADKNFWTSDELEGFFSPGTSFNFGEGPGNVEILIKFPIGGPSYDYNASRPSYLADPQGSLTITSLEDYDYLTVSSISERSYGKLVKCTFSGQIGRYNLEADQADGNPSVFLTDEVIELRDCELLFYVEYARI